MFAIFGNNLIDAFFVWEAEQSIKSGACFSDTHKKDILWVSFDRIPARYIGKYILNCPNEGDARLMITKCGALGRTDMLPYLNQATKLDSLYVHAIIAKTSIEEGFTFPISEKKSSSPEEQKMTEYIKYVNNIREKWRNKEDENLAEITKETGLKMGLKSSERPIDF